VERVITVAYYSLIKIDKSIPTDLSIAYNARWYPCTSIPAMIFDHNRIAESGLDALRREMLTEPLCFELLPEKFALNQLQRLYEAILVARLTTGISARKFSGFLTLSRSMSGKTVCVTNQRCCTSLIMRNIAVSKRQYCHYYIIMLKPKN